MTDMSKTRSRLQFLTKEIDACIAAGAYFAALQVSLALIDICARLEVAEDKGAGKRYKAWCADNLPNFVTKVSPEYLYELRCGIVHQATATDKYGHNPFLLLLPGNSVSFRGVFLSPAEGAGPTHAYDLVELCRDICKAAMHWADNADDKPNVSDNLEKVVSYHSGALDTGPIWGNNFRWLA